ncbi:hypothetical protein FRC01_002228 [Tulasnella sp. 417]|nr:hypothetical protein FRC01_002228 [Tulasnella sp. 417]
MGELRAIVGSPFLALNIDDKLVKYQAHPNPVTCINMVALAVNPNPKITEGLEAPFDSSHAVFRTDTDVQDRCVKLPTKRVISSWTLMDWDDTRGHCSSEFTRNVVEGMYLDVEVITHLPREVRITVEARLLVQPDQHAISSAPSITKGCTPDMLLHPALLYLLFLLT